MRARSPEEAEEDECGKRESRKRMSGDLGHRESSERIIGAAIAVHTALELG
jgi:hypothetical protein